MKIQVLRRKMSKIFFASIYEQKNVYYQVKNATFIGKSQFLSTLHSKSTFKSFQVFIPVTIRIWDLYRVKIWVSKPPWDPLGGANCHGKKELEPFRVPGEKQQFKVPAPSSNSDFRVVGSNPGSEFPKNCPYSQDFKLCLYSTFRP